MSTPNKTFYAHPLWAEKKVYWRPATLFFEGDLHTLRVPEFLTQFQLEKGNGNEGGLAYRQRAERTYYSNFLAATAHILCSYIFKEELDTEGLVKKQIFTQEELQNIDGEGTSLVDFVKNIFYMSATLGWSYINVDSPPLMENSSQLQAMAQGVRPYAWLWNPQEVVDWLEQTEIGPDWGKLIKLHREISKIGDRKDLSEAPTIETVRYEYSLEGGRLYRRTWKKETTEIKAEPTQTPIMDATGRLVPNAGVNQASWKLIAEGRSEWMDFLPIIRSRQKPWLKDAMYKNWQLYNMESSLDNILYYQAYTRTVIAGEPAEPAPGGKVAGGEDAILWIKAGGSVYPIPSENSDGLTARTQEVKNSIFRLGLYQLRQLNASSNAVQASDTLRQEKQNTYDHTKTKVQEIQDTVDEFLTLWGKFKNKDVAPEELQVVRKPEGYDLREFLEAYTASADARGKDAELQSLMVGEMLEMLGREDAEIKKIQNNILKGGENGIQDPKAGPINQAGGYPATSGAATGDNQSQGST